MENSSWDIMRRIIGGTFTGGQVERDEGGGLDSLGNIYLQNLLEE